LFKDIIALISVTDSTNDMGDPIKVQVKREGIFAEKKSIRQSEFYQAMAAGLKPELTFIIRSCEYNQEPTLEFNNKQYNIIRTYEKEDEFIELVCQGIVNGVI
jgi:SPP1 family predicted phage head-tail adaptor